tara:strand:+ start:714 stop:1043 length:330 start_codon:yes stop_codon:yes gene_type:complete
MTRQALSTRIPSFEKSGYKLSGYIRNFDTLGKDTFWMTFRRFDEMGQWPTKPLLELKNLGLRFSKIHKALNLLDYITVTRMQLGHFDTGILSWQHPMKGLWGRSTSALE